MLSEIDKIYKKREDLIKKIEQNKKQVDENTKLLIAEMDRLLPNRLPYGLEGFPVAKEDMEIVVVEKFSDIIYGYQVYVYNKLFYYQQLQDNASKGSEEEVIFGFYEE